jgi:hypothetical protein
MCRRLAGERSDIAEQLSPQRAAIGRPIHEFRRSNSKGLHRLKMNPWFDDEDRFSMFRSKRKPTPQFIKMRAILQVDVDDAVGRRFGMRDFAAR